MNEVNRQIWRDGTFVPWADATVHILSQSLQRGSLIFDYMSVHDTSRGPAVFRLSEHIDRFIASGKIVGLPLNYSKAELLQACVATVQQNPGSTSLKISALLAGIEIDIVPQDPTVAVFVAAYDSRTDIARGKPGKFHFAPELKLKVEREKTNRKPEIITPHAKVAANYTSPMMAKWQARREGYDDIILLNENDCVAEAPTANLFIAPTANNLVTPPGELVLLGITRATIVEMAPAMGLSCVERDIPVAELLDAPEVFLTGTSVGVWPVVQIENRNVGNGRVGDVTRRLAQRYQKIVSGEDPEFDHWMFYIDEN